MVDYFKKSSSQLMGSDAVKIFMDFFLSSTSMSSKPSSMLRRTTRPRRRCGTTASSHRRNYISVHKGAYRPWKSLLRTSTSRRQCATTTSGLQWSCKGMGRARLNDCVDCAPPSHTCIDPLRWVAAVHGSFFCWVVFFMIVSCIACCKHQAKPQ